MCSAVRSFSFESSTMTTPRDNSLGEGVFYAKNDYPGFVRRLVVITIDFSVLLVVGVVLSNVLPAIIRFGIDSDGTL